MYDVTIHTYTEGDLDTRHTSTGKVPEQMGVYELSTTIIGTWDLYVVGTSMHQSGGLKGV